MAKLKIYSFPDVVLTKKAAPIARVEKTYYKLADDMFETMYDAPGIGLAANQVGILERILVLDVEYAGVHKDPWGGTRTGFTVTGALNRKDFGLSWNAALETGGVLVGDKIKLELEIEAVLEQTPATVA